jgi:hypothetical protein
MTKQKTLKLKVDGINSKQWTNFVIELNLMAKAWKPYGVDVKLLAPGKPFWSRSCSRTRKL